MKNEGSVGAYVGGTGPIGLPEPKRRKHRASKSRHVCATCALPLVRPGAFHICLDLTKPEPVVVKVKVKKATTKPRRTEVAKTASRCACGADISRGAKTCHRCLGLSRRALTDAQVAEIVEAYTAGASAVSLAHRYGTHDTTIAKMLRLQGVQIRTRNKRATKLCACGSPVSREASKCVPCMALSRRKLTTEQEVEIAAAYIAGETALDLGKKYGASATAITEALGRQGVPTRGRGGYQRRKVA